MSGPSAVRGPEGDDDESSANGVEERTAKTGSDRADKLGMTHGMAVQELGWDEDVDDDLRIEIEDAIDGELVEEAVEVVDVVMLWWRDDDGDLADGLMDTLTDLSESGYIWLLTPKVGREGFIDASELSEAAVTAGLSLTSNTQVSPDWAAHKFVRTKGRR